MTSSTTPTTVTTHPLAPLTADEVKAATDILTGSHRIAEGSRFVSVSLQEPPKEEVLAWDGAAVARRKASTTAVMTLRTSAG
jgi:primary-amine oxidase